jgi:hypothetical protein
MNVEKHFEFHSKKNKPQPDKATATHSALPWAQGGNGIECAGRYRVGSVNSIGTREGAANMDLIVKAVNEHAALVAVADSFLVEENPYRTPEQVKALAALAAVRGGGK